MDTVPHGARRQQASRRVDEHRRQQLRPKASSLPREVSIHHAGEERAGDEASAARAQAEEAIREATSRQVAIVLHT